MPARANRLSSQDPMEAFGSFQRADLGAPPVASQFGAFARRGGRGPLSRLLSRRGQAALPVQGSPPPRPQPTAMAQPARAQARPGAAPARPAAPVPQAALC
jgi:hypothetical protein